MDDSTLEEIEIYCLDSLVRVLIHLRDNLLVPVFTGGGDTNLLSTRQEEAAFDDRNKDNNM